MLERLHLLFPPMKDGPYSIDMDMLEDEGLIGVVPNADVDEPYALVVVDEAHVIFSEHKNQANLTSTLEFRVNLIKSLVGPSTEQLILSDISQSRVGSDIAIPSGLAEVQLTQVVRFRQARMPLPNLME